MIRAEWRGKLSLGWQRAHTSLWFIPALLVVAAGLLSTAMLRLDRALGTGYAGGWWLFGGNAEGARTVLSVIAGSLITVVAVAFSVTMIAIQQASTQFTPRVLRNFTRDRGNQLVLGWYIATFTYALLVLRRVRELGDDDAEFVPSIAISTGMLLALVSLGFLIYFVHHASESLQVNAVLSSVRGELDRELEHLFPARLGDGEQDPADFDAMVSALAAECVGREETLRSEREGYLRRIEEHELSTLSKLGVRFVRVEVRIGEYVTQGDALVRVWSDRPLDPEFRRRARSAFQLDRERSVHQDPLFGIRQLVDIGVKALSPGVNDPTTAEQALDHLGGAVALLLERAIPSPLRNFEGGMRVLFRTPSFADYLDASFAQIRRAARGDLHVSLYLLGTLQKLKRRASSPGRAAALELQIEQLLAGVDRGSLTDAERELLRAPEPSNGVLP